jgi:putative oxidoreductase
MKISTIIARLVLGLIYTAFSLAYFFNLLPQQEQPQGNAGQFLTGLFVAGYIMPLVKALELLTGLAFLSGRLVPMASVVIFPITLNIFLFHLVLAQDSLLIPGLMLAANVFLFYAYRERYNGLLAFKN